MPYFADDPDFGQLQKSYDTYQKELEERLAAETWKKDLPEPGKEQAAIPEEVEAKLRSATREEVNLTGI